MADAAYVGSKLLQEAIYPLNWSLLCLVLGLWCMIRQRRRAAIGLQIVGLALLIAPATGFVAQTLMAPLELAYPARVVDLYEPADAIVVLGGTQAPLRAPRLEAEETHGARLQMAVRLYRAAKAKKIVVSGGPYLVEGERYRTEAEDMRDVLVGLGVPLSAIQMETNSRNTFENAAFTAKLLKERGESKVLLVTSALHMPRAMALFRKQGVEATPAPCSFLSGARHGPLSGLKPEAAHVLQSEAAIKEYIGRFAYWILGKA